MKEPSVGVLVLAAGKGTRMKSGLPKVLHPILDRPMLGYLLETSASCGFAAVAAVVGYEGKQVCDYLRSRFPSAETIRQEEQLGTGHAVRISRPWWERFDNVLVLNGDLPLLRSETLRSLFEFHRGAACSMLSFVTDHPDGYGRILRSRGGIAIVEHGDATPEQRLVREANAGCYLFDTEALSRVIGRLNNENAQGEYYLPDAVNLMSGAGMEIRALPAEEEELAGVNTQAELAAATARVRDFIVQKWMSAGVYVMDPSAVWIGPDALLAPDVRLMPGVQIWGDS
ncbi:MAG: NTP transferase domain-containing protein, partial [Synergistaceae bacterium]|nr:NTP transferase domain-containing protein [Synergistaceae bacterium]